MHPRRLTQARAFASLDVRSFRRFFLSQVVSVSGSSMQTIGQAWLILTLHGTGVDLGGAISAQLLPSLLLGPYGGLIADRYNKRHLLLATQASAALSALLLAILTASGAVRLWMVFGLAFLLGCINAVDNPVRQVFALDLVPRHLVSNAVSLNEVVFNASRVVGPALGALLVAQLGVASCFFVNAASFSLPMLAVASVHPDKSAHAPVVPQGSGQLREGLRYAWSTPILRHLLLMAAAAAMIFNFTVSLPMMAKSELHVGVGGFGSMVTAFGVGAIGGALLAACERDPRGRLVRTLALLSGLVVVAAAVMPTLGSELVVMVVLGAFSIWFVSLANAIVQLRTIGPLRGRLMGLWSMALPGSLVLSGPLVGWISLQLGPRAALASGGIAVLAATAIGWRALAADDVPFTTLPGAHAL
ncbi:MAG: hypothetical protein QOI76_930 [Frankiales bacterium]|jgi:MFS family permease|nr:hypothetical protein [Frankiales bacterium]